MKCKKEFIIGLFLLVAISCFSLNFAWAAQEIEYKPGEKIKVKISDEKVNRIQFGSSPIVQIIGDESRYGIIIDEGSTNIFLTSKVGEEETIDLSIINAKGEIADLTLQPSEIEGQIITINNIDYQFNLREEKEIAEMFKHMIRGDKNKYYVKKAKRVINKLQFKGMGIVQDITYRYGNLTGTRLIVTNNNRRNNVLVTDEEIGEIFENSLAVAIDKKTIRPRERSFVWVITKDKSNG